MPDKTASDVLGKLVQLWDSYCDEMACLEQQPSLDSFLMHDKVKPIMSSLFDLCMAALPSRATIDTEHEYDANTFNKGRNKYRLEAIEALRHIFNQDKGD